MCVATLAKIDYSYSVACFKYALFSSISYISFSSYAGIFTIISELFDVTTTHLHKEITKLLVHLYIISYRKPV